MIPESLFNQRAQLAEQSKSVSTDVDTAVAMLADKGFYFDLKFDGIRCLAYVDDGVVTLINRNALDITHRYPDLVAALGTIYPSGSVVLDSEVVVLKDGMPWFEGAHKRDAQSNPRAIAGLLATYPATMMVFDILWRNGDDLRKLPYTARRALLKTEAVGFTAAGETIQWARSEREGAAMWQFVQQMSMEGLIAKSPSAPYRAGRGGAWVKLKPIATLSALVSGYDAGKGARSNTFGNLHLVLVKGSDLVPIGKVGSGFTDAMLKELLPRLTNPTPEPLIVEVEYQSVTRDGQLRFPVFRGLRSDLGIADCSVSQLD